MSEYNFRSIEQLMIPDELTERLLAIPEESERRPTVPLWRRRALVAAASFVLVAAMSILVYFSTGNIINKPPAVSPRPLPTFSGTEKEGTAAFDSSTPSVSPGGTPSPTASREGTIALSPTQSRRHSTTTPPTSGHPAGQPFTEGGTVNNPTAPPTNAPTAPPTQKPTRRPYPEPVAPTEGDDPDTPEPIETPVENYCYAYIRADDPGESLYCWIEDENGDFMGDGKAFTARHQAQIAAVYSNGYVLARWSPNENGIYPSEGYHRYTFVTGDGTIVFRDYDYVFAYQARADR